jgi:hypothetical protein
MIILYDCLLSTSAETIINVLMIMVIISPLSRKAGLERGRGVRSVILLVEEVAGGLAVTLSLPKGRSVGP